MTHQRRNRRSTPDGAIAIAGIVLVATRRDNTAHTARRPSVAQHVGTLSALRPLSPSSSSASSGTDDSLAASATDCSLPAGDQWGPT